MTPAMGFNSSTVSLPRTIECSATADGVCPAVNLETVAGLLAASCVISTVKGSVGIRFMYPLDTSSDKDVGALRWSSVNCPINERNRLWVLKKSNFLPNRQNWEDPKILGN
jgi:hypothetical protein